MGSGNAIRFAVRRWSAWAPGRETRQAWRAWVGTDGEEPDEPSPAVPMMLRRRATPLGQRMLAAALDCAPPAGHVRYVLASRHGEFSRMPAILGALAAGELPSPAEFSMSVHHALAGLLSIATGNTAGHTALSAGLDTFGYGLVEAAATIADEPRDPVVMVYGDEPLPEPYAIFGGDDRDLPLVVAVAAGFAGDEGEAIIVEASPRPTAGAAQEALALSFLAFLISGAPEAACDGEAMRWKWRRA